MKLSHSKVNPSAIKTIDQCKRVHTIQSSYHEEGHGAAPVDSAVLDVGLVSQVVRRLNGDLHPLYS